MASDSAAQFVHPEYKTFMAKWDRARTVVAGEDSIKAAGESYIPKLTGQSDDEFSAYLKRGQFFNATGRTLSGLHGMLFRKEPLVTLEDEFRKRFESDCDMVGTSLATYAKRTAREVLTTGRAGTWVDWSETEGRSAFVFYKAESVLNWGMRRFKGRMHLAFVVLYELVAEHGIEASEVEIVGEESETVEQIRVLRLSESPRGELFYTVERWRYEGSDKPEWVLKEKVEPRKKGKTIPFIPFVFHSASEEMICCCNPPLDDIIAVNLHHYRVTADYNHGLHYAALPTAWVAGWPEKSELKIGSGVAWVTENTQAKAGFLEFTGQGLGGIEKALESDERQMAVLGARLIEQQKRAAETAEAMQIRQGGETSVLSLISSNLSSELTTAIRMAVWWMSVKADLSDVETDTARIEVNRDFNPEKLSSEQLTALVASWVRGAISRQTLLWNMRQGEIIPPNRSDDEEIELIEQDAKLLGKADDGRGKEGDGKSGKPGKGKAKA